MAELESRASAPGPISMNATIVSSSKQAIARWEHAALRRRVVRRLVDAYRSSGRRTAGPEAGGDGALEDALARLVARGRADHPSLEVSDLAFAAHLGRCGASVAEPPRDLQISDL